MYNTLKAEHLAARKARNSARASVIVGVIDDVDKHLLKDRKAAEKNGTEYLVRDSEVLAVLKNTIKNMNKTIVDISNSPGMEESVLTYRGMIECLSEFLPPSVSGDDLRMVIQNLGAKTLGQAMGLLKKTSVEHGYDYDGAEAATLAKELFI